MRDSDSPKGSIKQANSLIRQFGPRVLGIIRAAQRDLGDDLGGHSATDLLLDQISALDYDAAAALVYYAEGEISTLPRRFRRDVRHLTEPFTAGSTMVDLRDPGGKSALRAATRKNPRNLPCPTCGEPNRLTPSDVVLGYQCDQCADRAEGSYFGGDY